MHRIETTRTTHQNRIKIFGGACPTFFRLLCMTAEAGGDSFYDTAGYELARHLDDLAPYDIDEETWRGRIQVLKDLTSTPGTNEEIVAWFRENLPRCSVLVPSDYRGWFAEGVRVYAETKGL